MQQFLTAAWRLVTLMLTGLAAYLVSLAMLWKLAGQPLGPETRALDYVRPALDSLGARRFQRR